LGFPGNSDAGNMIGWHEKLDDAKSEREVVEIARDYLATLDYFQVNVLPKSCRPRKVLTPDDVASYAFDLVRYQYDVTDESAELITRLAAFFATANARLSQLALKTNDERIRNRFRGTVD
jgi:hypothetical protein